ncbi:MAG: LCP family protein [Candidatus Levyibacteriota bacterium]
MPKKIFLIVAVFLVVLFAVKVGPFIVKFFPVAATVVLHQAPALKETNGRTSILLLGTGGANHDGPNLTDTIIYATIDLKTDKVTLVSIPRDLWVADVANGNGGKINEAYADGQLNNQHKGLLLAKTIVGNVVGQPIHYGFRIDFGGFMKAVDLLGGIDVHVQNTLDDYNYPIDGKEDDACGHSAIDVQTFMASAPADLAQWDFFPCRYMHLHVPAGVVHMDGQTALEFVRSRHGVGEEGSDFARSRRQQLVIEAFRAQALSAGTLFNPAKIIGLYTILKDSIDTDISQEDFGAFISLAQKLKSATIQSAVLDEGDAVQNRAGLLTEGAVSVYNGFFLIPRVGETNYSEIQAYVSCLITKGACSVSATPKPSVSQR